MAADVVRAPLVITHESGLKFAAQVRSHRVVVDQPLGAGGDDAGPMPIELLGVSLGTCIALYVQQFCESRGVAYDGMRVEVEQHHVRNPSRIGDFKVRVVLPTELPAHHAALLERVATSCPAHNTLEMGAAVAVRIETGAAVLV
jgi:uncharacterized OsmC-like protein